MLATKRMVSNCVGAFPPSPSGSLKNTVTVGSTPAVSINVILTVVINSSSLVGGVGLLGFGLSLSFPQAIIS